jgi:SPP1 gp7 family putative phage head morphogenesis protein
MAHSLANNTRYMKFVRARNKALEKFHLQTQFRISRHLQDILAGVKDMIASRYSDIISYGIYSPQGKEKISRLEIDLKRMISLLAPVITHEVKHLRRICYILTYATEAEAIAQAIGKQTNYQLTRDKVHMIQRQETFGGGNVEERVQYVLNKLHRKIMNAVELSAVNEDNISDAMNRVKSVLPKRRQVSLEPRNLSVGPVLREADNKELPDMSTGFVDDETWNEMVDSYQSDVVPDWRGPDQSYTFKKEDGSKKEVYAWEMEQEITQDFVYQVRLSQIDAAKENGIKDYVWVAIVDNRTDDCCVWRDGLTTAEIEAKLKSERKDDECQSIVPPAHFNCRCVLAPMVEEMPEAVESNEKDFEQWLNS